MSQETRSLLLKFKSFIERLYNGINKGLDGKLVAFKMMEVEVKKRKR
jgi:hypothetical protein